MQDKAVNCNKIKIVIKEVLRTIGNNVHDRKLIKIYSGITYLTYIKKKYVFLKSENTLRLFIKRLAEVSSIKLYMIKYVSSIRVIQKKWRLIIQSDKARKLIIANKWNLMIRKLILTHKKKGKKEFAAKLGAIPTINLKKIITKYYYQQKKKYLNSLTKLAKRIIDKNIGIKRKYNKKSHVISKFEYIPNEETLKNMIISAIQK